MIVVLGLMLQTARHEAFWAGSEISRLQVNGASFPVHVETVVVVVVVSRQLVSKTEASNK